jgi:hypothetical protein
MFIRGQILSASPNLAKDVPLLGECRPLFLPVSIPAHGAIHLLVLNPKRLKAISWGLSDAPNDTDQAVQWPPKEKMQEAAQSHNFVMITYQCGVTNQGNQNLLNVAIPMRFWFGNKGGDENAVNAAPIISPLNAGQTAYFYAINDCDIHVAGIVPDTAKVKVAGSSTWYEVPLNRQYRDPVEQFMTFFPSKVRWIGGECE